jgi:hypothetical protein
MSATSYHTSITACLSSLGYREVPENKTIDEVSMASNNKVYFLNWAGTNTLTYFTSDRIMYSHIFTLEVKYKNINSLERVTNADLFTTLLNELSKLTSFMGFVNDAVFEQIDNKHSKGSIIFTIGVETNC